ncbi:cation:proton antiporter [Phormidium pseudopriestleyi FRX01]|uniref:Cation:proton antiporter n=1 Tax=Phormidium pseudopriestleyi FRX01 TaxID=1759528 RepID=A0ABS3FYR4_9CYAN|nr:cation:proton antiporter [Phormidium pseudopriestleyi]MBO0352282.1 cation:proton antiporter [Phormidium pseudopriestleyi FRX01]
MLISTIWILGMGFFAGQFARRLGAPPLIGMILVGIILGPEVGNRLEPGILAAADDLRTVAVMIILMKAGLGLDREKLAEQGTVALRLGILPAILEAIAIAIAAMFLFQFDLLTGLLLGCIIAAESPAVIVPGMLRLKRLGWGVEKGIPDAILTGSALSDVVLLLVFSLLLNFLQQGEMERVILPGRLSLNPLLLLPLQAVMQVILGTIAGYLAAQLLVSLLEHQSWSKNQVQDVLIAAVVAAFAVIAARQFPYFSGYLAVMSMGFFLIELDAPLARQLRNGFNTLWIVAEIVLFVLMGASIHLQVLGEMFLPGLAILAVGLLIGRTLGWTLSTAGSNWNWQEKLFLLPGNSAKATVQAALGALPLAYGIEGGEIILAIAALAILVTAPLGAWAIPTFAPKLLKKGEVDPTKVTVNARTLFLAAVDRSPGAMEVLKQTADLARRSHGEAIVLYVVTEDNPEEIQAIQKITQGILADIRHRFMTEKGPVVDTILAWSQAHPVTAIVVGKRPNPDRQGAAVGSVSQGVLAGSRVPVLVVQTGDIAVETAQN